jgi:DNA-binding MarR family transcriptional regulator
MSNKDELFNQLFKFGKLMRSRMEKSGPLPTAQLATLYFVAERDDPTMHDIARHHRVTAPSATTHIQELVRSGYLERRSDETDRRRIRLVLTPKGSRIIEDEVKKKKRVIESIFSDLSEKDREQFITILSKILSTQQ